MVGGGNRSTMVTPSCLAGQFHREGRRRVGIVGGRAKSWSMRQRGREKRQGTPVRPKTPQLCRSLPLGWVQVQLRAVMEMLCDYLCSPSSVFLKGRVTFNFTRLNSKTSNTRLVGSWVRLALSHLTLGYCLSAPSVLPLSPHLNDRD